METSIQKNWIKAGMISGFITIITYPVMILVSMPVQLQLVLASFFGFFFIITSLGLYHLLSMNKKTVSSQLGVIFTIVGCSVVIMMLTIQLALFHLKETATIEATKEMKNYIFQFPNMIQLGLDVVWDLFMGVGTILLALNMYKHPRFGKIFSISGVLITLALLVLNIYTFPIPPGESGSVDLGPLVALWYLAVTIQIARSFKWVDEQDLT
jgi:Domain of unknown function (DUF4386)